MPRSDPQCALCEPGSHDEGICRKIRFSCGHSAHADCQHIKWFTSCCWVCRARLTKGERGALSSSFYDGDAALAEDFDYHEEARAAQEASQ